MNYLKRVVNLQAIERCIVGYHVRSSENVPQSFELCYQVAGHIEKKVMERALWNSKFSIGAGR